jgi:DNA-binding winged helix-turn-helix (wHTH) protein
VLGQATSGGLVTKKTAAGRARSAAVEARATRLLEGEDPSTTYPEDAAQWIRVYEELIGFKDRMLARMNEDIRGISRVARAELKSQDVQEFEIQRGGYQVRMVYWQRRQLELRGIDLDPETRVLRSNGHRAVLTKRQYQLLAVLIAYPGRHFKASQLAQAAWESDKLSAEQVRNYLVQLRQVLVEVGVPCRIVSQARLGYTLEFEGAGRG